MESGGENTATQVMIPCFPEFYDDFSKEHFSPGRVSTLLRVSVSVLLTEECQKFSFSQFI